MDLKGFHVHFVDMLLIINKGNWLKVRYKTFGHGVWTFILEFSVHFIYLFTFTVIHPHGEILPLHFDPSGLLNPVR